MPSRVTAEPKDWRTPIRPSPWRASDATWNSFHRHLMDNGESECRRSLIPQPPDVADWEAYEAARQKLVPNLSLSAPAARYSVEANLQLH